MSRTYCIGYKSYQMNRKLERAKTYLEKEWLNSLLSLKGNKRETEKEGTSKQKEGTLASVYRYTTRVVLPTGPDADYLSVRRSGPTNLSLAPSLLKPVTYLGQRRKRVPHLMMQGTRRLSPSLARDARKVLITGVRIQPFIAPKLRFL